MKNIELLRLKNGLQACSGMKGKFGYAIAKNSRLAGIVLADLQKTIEEADEYKAFQKARISLCEERAVKDEKTGKAKMEIRADGVGTYVFEDQSVFEAELEELKASDEHKEAVDRHDEKITAYNKLMAEGEADFTPHMIPESLIPFDDLTAAQMEGVFDLIIEADGGK